MLVMNEMIGNLRRKIKIATKKRKRKKNPNGNPKTEKNTVSEILKSLNGLIAEWKFTGERASKFVDQSNYPIWRREREKLEKNEQF